MKQPKHPLSCRCDFVQPQRVKDLELLLRQSTGRAPEHNVSRNEQFVILAAVAGGYVVFYGFLIGCARRRWLGCARWRSRCSLLLAHSPLAHGLCDRPTLMGWGIVDSVYFSVITFTTVRTAAAAATSAAVSGKPAPHQLPGRRARWEAAL